MNITIICVGKLKEKFWKQACGEYLKRMRPYANVSVCEVADVDPRVSGGEEIAREREGEAILRVLEKRLSVSVGANVCSGVCGSSGVRTGGKSRAGARLSAGANASLKPHPNTCPPNAHIFLLAIEGKQRTSVEFSQHLDDLKLDGVSDFVFVIGGSTGVSRAVYEVASEFASFGKITLPHNLARVVLLEQIYRAFKISRGEPYHK